MRVNKITYTPQNFCGKKQKKVESPLKVGLTTTAVWTGFGFAFQVITNKATKLLKSEKKASILINVGLAAVFGIIDAVKTAKRNKPKL